MNSVATLFAASWIHRLRLKNLLGPLSESVTCADWNSSCGFFRHPVWYHDPGAGWSDHHCVWENGLQCSAWVQTEGMAVFCSYKQMYLLKSSGSFQSRVGALELLSDKLLKSFIDTVPLSTSHLTFLDVSLPHTITTLTIPPTHPPPTTSSTTSSIPWFTPSTARSHHELATGTCQRQQTWEPIDFHLKYKSCSVSAVIRLTFTVVSFGCM